MKNKRPAFAFTNALKSEAFNVTAASETSPKYIVVLEGAVVSLAAANVKQPVEPFVPIVKIESPLTA